MIGITHILTNDLSHEGGRRQAASPAQARSFITHRKTIDLSLPSNNHSVSVCKTLSLSSKRNFFRNVLKLNGLYGHPKSYTPLNECFPPFSLFREYVSLLFEYKKQFLILGRMSALHYIEVFPRIMDGTMWCGVGFNLSMVYLTSYENNLEANKKFVRSKGYDPNKNFIKVPAICWYTNLDHKKRHEELVLYKKYNAVDYPKYDNYDAINVDKVTDIPLDYILGQYNPDQFEILGACIPEYVDKLGIKRIGEVWMAKYRASGGTGHYTANMKSLVLYENNGTPRAIYSRIIVRNKNPKKDLI